MSDKAETHISLPRDDDSRLWDIQTAIIGGQPCWSPSTWGCSRGSRQLP